MRERLRLFLSMLLVAGALAAPVAPGAARAEAPGAPLDAGLTSAEIDDLVATLEDADERARLIARLKSLRAAAAADRERVARGAGGRLMERLSGDVDELSKHLAAGLALMLDAPRLAAWLRDRAGDAATRGAWWAALWKIAAVLVLSLLAESLARRLLARSRAAVEEQKRDSPWLRLSFLVARAFLDLVPIAAFAVSGYALLPFLEPAAVTRLVAIALLNAVVMARGVMVVARVTFAPRAPNLRVLDLGDEDANYLTLWTRRLANLAIYGYFFTETALLLGLPRGGYLALARVIGLLFALLVAVFILQNRQLVAAWIRGPQSSPVRGVRVLRRRLGDAWHVLGVVYVGAVYLVWALGVEGGFEFVFRATALSVLIVVAARLLMLGSRRALDRGFGIRPQLVRQYPGLAARANRYFAVLHMVASGAIVGVAALALLGAWGIDPLSWIGADAWRRVLGGVFTSVLVIVIAVVLWEMASSVIERHLARDAEGGARLSARARTLLPLLRRVLMIVVATLVGFVVLSEIGVDIGPLLAGAGVVGLAIGIGSQTLVKDMITGVFILIENQFTVGDVVSVGGKTGVVEDISIRTIRMRDLSGNVHVIPFSSVSTVENMTREFSCYVFDVGVAYSEDVDEVIAVLRELGEELRADETHGRHVREPLEIMGLNEFGDSAVVVRARVTTTPGDQWMVGREFNRRIKRRFDELGIEIPFPQRTVHFGEERERARPEPARAAARTDDARGATDGDA